MTQGSLPFSGRTPTARSCSLAAAQSAIPHAGTQAARVLSWYRLAGEAGLTDWELLAVDPGISRSALCARRNALMDAGLLEEAGSRLSGPFQKRCTVYRPARRTPERATPEGAVA